MLEWLFGSKKEKKSQAKKPQGNEDWQFQFLLQFLTSPLWKESILSFADTQCIVFDNEDENKFQYTRIHKQFKEMVANLFDGMMQEIGMQSQMLAQLIGRGFQSKHEKVFNQLLLCDDFLRFKHFMVTRNRKLEQAAIKALHESKSDVSSKINRAYPLVKEQTMTEKQELQKIIEISAMEAKERQLLELTEIQINKKIENNTKNKKQQVQKYKQQPQVLQNKIIQEPKEIQIKLEDKQEQISKIQKRAQRIRKARAKQEQKSSNKQLPQLKQKKSFQPLPPVKQSQKKQLQQQQFQFINKEENIASSAISNAQKHYPPTKDIEKQSIKQIKQQKIQQKEKQVNQQGNHLQPMEERKKRLLEQRQRIRREKKKEEQQNTATIVLQDDGVPQTQVQQQQNTISKEEVQRRKQLMKRIRKRIVDDF